MSILTTNTENIETLTTSLYNGSNGTSYGVINGFNNVSSSAVAPLIISNDSVRLEESVTLDVKGKLRINGEFLHERLERIETVLQIPTRDVEMENKYPKLKKLYEEYTKELAKYKTWEKLKESK